MIKVILLLTILLLCSVAIAGEVIGFFEYEVYDRGLTKMCVYSTIRGNMAINISSAAICPVTYRFYY